MKEGEGRDFKISNWGRWDTLRMCGVRSRRPVALARSGNLISRLRLAAVRRRRGESGGKHSGSDISPTTSTIRCQHASEWWHQLEEADCQLLFSAEASELHAPCFAGGFRLTCDSYFQLWWSSTEKHQHTKGFFSLFVMMVFWWILHFWWSETKQEHIFSVRRRGERLRMIWPFLPNNFGLQFVEEKK